MALKGKIKVMRTKTKQASMTKVEANNDVESFLHDIGNDFYINLPRYATYADVKFNTDDLSMTEIVSIAECYVLNGGHESIISRNNIDINILMGVVVNRLLICDSDLATAAEEIVSDLECFAAIDENRKDPVPEKLINKSDYDDTGNSRMDNTPAQPARKSMYD